jgi:citrate lyase subunit beta/citryl-CoA lyase
VKVQPRRSALYVPGINARALEKARGLPADSLILDLEDSVAPAMKDEARRNLVSALEQGGFASEVIVRVNAAATPWHDEDMRAIIAAAPGAILLPKVERPEAVLAATETMERLGASQQVRLWAMIETPRAVAAPLPIAETAAQPGARLDVFVVGANDLAKDTRVRPRADRAFQVPWLMASVAAARAAGVDILDGVYNALDDEAGFRAECEQGRDMGMDGKTLIHPRQIAPCHAVFSPSTDEIAAARRIVEAFEDPTNRDAGVIRLDGQMVERLHAEAARRTLAVAEAMARRSNGQAEALPT